MKQFADEIIESIAELTKHTDREQLEASLASTLYKLLDIERAALYRIHYEYNQPEFTLILEVVDDELQILRAGQPAEDENAGIVIELKKSLLNKEPTLIHLSHEKSLYLHPISNHLNEITTIFALSGSDENYRDHENLIMYYFQIYRNYLKLLDESEYDALTGLLNRRTFDRDLAKLIAEWLDRGSASRSNDENIERRKLERDNSNWLAVVDVDFFKRINDNYGHLFGDEVLLLLANIMRESFRNYDKLFRFGGEEFVVILCSTDHTGAEAAFSRFHNKVNEHPFPQIGKITVSVGYEEIANQTIPSEVLRLADDALYYVKEHGRNQVCCYRKLLADNKITPPAQAVRKDDLELF